MMLYHVYVRRGIAYVPAVARTEAGYFLDVEPVDVVSLLDTRGLRTAVKRALERGNAIVPTPTRPAFPKPFLPKYAKVKSWATFEKGAVLWTITEHNGPYKIYRGRRRSDRGWEEDPASVRVLPLGATYDEIAERASELIGRTTIAGVSDDDV